MNFELERTNIKIKSLKKKRQVKLEKNQEPKVQLPKISRFGDIPQISKIFKFEKISKNRFVFF